MQMITHCAGLRYHSSTSKVTATTSTAATTATSPGKSLRRVTPGEPVRCAHDPCTRSEAKYEHSTAALHLKQARAN